MTARISRTTAGLRLTDHHCAVIVEAQEFPAEVHPQFRRQYETVSHELRAGVACAGFLRSFFGGDPGPGTHPDDGDVEFALFFGDRPRKAADRVLGYLVGGGTDLAAAAGRVDDVSRSLRFHVGEGVPGAEERPAEVGLNDLVPEAQVQLGDSGPMRDS